jgi:hypothetical protein
MGSLSTKSPRLGRASLLGRAAILLQRDSFYYTLLVLLFLCSFCVPLFVAIRVINGWSTGAVPSVVPSSKSESSTAVPLEQPAITVVPVPSVSEPSVSASDTRREKEISPDPWRVVTFDDDRSFLRVGAATQLLPVRESDFAVLLWARPRKLPAPGEGMVLLSKVESQGKSRAGYQLLLSRDASALRPQIYWRTEGRLGGVYNFSEISIQTGRWIGFAMSLRGGRFLGLHMVRYEESPDTPEGPPRGGSVELLGGYDLGREMFPSNNADLLVGPFNRNLYRGDIGPFGVLRGEGLAGSLRESLTELAKEPREPLAVFDRSMVQFWTIDGRSDLSLNQIPVSLVDRE